MTRKLPFGIEKLRFINWFGFFAMVVLMTIGVFFVYSANASREAISLQNLWREHLKISLACVGFNLIVPLIDYRKLLSLGWVAYLGSLFLLLAVLLIGTSLMGARRWVFGIQPSELAKVATIMMIAWYLGRRGAAKDVWDFLVVMAVISVPVAFIFLQPDLGTAIVFLPVAVAMLFASGTAMRVVGTLVLVGVLAVTVVLGSLILLEKPETPMGVRKVCSVATSFLGNYQKGRLLVFLFPDRDPLGSGWNRRQSQIAIGSGGLHGKGYLKGDQNILGFLPQQVSANDFIFSVLAEEKGFVGSIFLLACYGILLLSVLAAGVAAPDESGRLLCVGIATLLFCHVFINIGMTVGIMPVTGVPLPFVSYGRTFMVALGVAMGLVQCVAVRSGVHKKEQNRNEL